VAENFSVFNLNDRMPVKYYDENGKELSDVEIQRLKYNFRVIWTDATRVGEPFRRFVIEELIPLER
jgi:hypothetical protein